MSDEPEAPSARAYLRRPRFHATDKRTPRAAILHALPAFFVFASNIWIWTMALVAFFSAYFNLPRQVMLTGLAIVAVPATLTCWGLLVRFIEVEASLDI